MRRAAMALAVAGGALALAAAPLAARAHVTVWPRQSQLGAREAYVIRMPNEKKAATVRLDAEFPPEARVTPKAGATLTWKFVQTYADGTKVEWTGAPGTPTPAPQVRLLPVAPLP
jgi:uncharacterized protein YcnI